MNGIKIIYYMNSCGTVSRPQIRSHLRKWSIALGITLTLNYIHAKICWVIKGRKNIINVSSISFIRCLNIRQSHRFINCITNWQPTSVTSSDRSWDDKNVCIIHSVIYYYWNLVIPLDHCHGRGLFAIKNRIILNEEWSVDHIYQSIRQMRTGGRGEEK